MGIKRCGSAARQSRESGAAQPQRCSAAARCCAGAQALAVGEAVWAHDDPGQARRLQLLLAHALELENTWR